MGEKEMKILIFNLNGENYATDIKNVERILGFIEPTEMPDVPDFVEGVINYADEILPIINLQKKFKFASKRQNDDDKKIVVIKKENNKFGVIVDTVYEVADVNNESFKEAPTITTKISGNYIKGLIKLEEKIIILLDIEKILTEKEEKLIF